MDFSFSLEVLVDLDYKKLMWIDVARILIGKNIPLSK